MIFNTWILFVGINFKAQSQTVLSFGYTDHVIYFLKQYVLVNSLSEKLKKIDIFKNPSQGPGELA